MAAWLPATLESRKPGKEELKMRRMFTSLLLAAALIGPPVLLSGCAARVRVYDQYHHDYHRWDHHETVVYQQWEVETHRPHQDFNHRSAEEQKEYWDWRHSH
ncbi:MAG TPA: hypothetical protein VMH00_12640 [Candidatus Limnocylindrales bacterium]|nr:hypothetical protein [Candidatus Limnocylindrales bacterium]